ncbi:MAG: type VI secretion system baseplate subunit TssF [Planctomycetota bacterium]|jgi:type VI secretion system protein ImpG
MSEELLSYYHQELSFIRRLGAEFAEQYPKIAARLQLGPDAAEDPHVERIIEAFAYLNARIRHKLEDDFPEITDALLSVLYPHYQAPVPSMAVVQFELDRDQGELTTGYEIPRESAIETEPIEGEPCRFRTNYPVTLWPIHLVSAELSGRPFSAPQASCAPDALAVLRLRLACFAQEMTFSQLRMQSLRFFLQGQEQHVYPLYELIFNNTIGVALASSAGDKDAVLLNRGCIRPVGFERDEGMLPYTARSMLGYRLLAEFFTFPQKYLFFDLAGLRPEALAKIGNQMEVFLYLNRSVADLEQNVAADTFRLGCTPMVNLYRQRAEPIALDHTETEYRVVPDARRPRAHEIYTVDRVTATSPQNERLEFQPFFSFKHASDQKAQKAFWYGTRRPAGRVAGQIDRGTEVYLSLVDLGFQSAAPADWTLDVETSCLNRDLPHRLPFGKGQLSLRLSRGGPLSGIECLTRPTPTFRPALKRGALWRVISHLSLNHLSLVDQEVGGGEEGAYPLREILKLYDFADSAENRSMIEGVKSVAGRRVVGRTRGELRGGFCRGVEVTVHLEEERFSGSGIYLFSCVLERFLGLYCSVNSFSKLVVTTTQREGELRRWPPRAGETVLL